MKKVLFLVVVAIAMGNAQAAYRCVDEKGVTHVGDMPARLRQRADVRDPPSGAVLKRTTPRPPPRRSRRATRKPPPTARKDKVAAEQRARTSPCAPPSSTWRATATSSR
jgi:hypothetical protein